MSDRDFCVVYDPNVGDEMPLTCALSMAKVVAIASIVLDSNDDFDLNGAQRKVSVIRGLLE